MNELSKKELYAQKIIRLNCAKVQGRTILAKPIFLIAIISAIQEKHITQNQFYWNPADTGYQKLKELYKDTYIGYLPCIYQTPLYKPFFHLKHERFWHLKVRGDIQEPKSSSINYLKNNVDYAYLDTDLWDLLQDPAVREEYKELIIDFYLKANI
jgi:putative restriction endonuclease